MLVVAGAGGTTGPQRLRRSLGPFPSEEDRTHAWS